MTDFWPQPYPLWCAEIAANGHSTFGRVIGWQRDDRIIRTVVAQEAIDGTGTIGNIGVVAINATA